MAETSKTGGADRLVFTYSGSSTSIVDYSGPNNTGVNRSYSFANLGGIARASSLTSPCPLCGNTASYTTYGDGSNANGGPNAFNRIIRSRGHDQTITFYQYNAAGQEIEKAVFGNAYVYQTTRPALNLAKSVTSTEWHPTYNLPLLIAEPNRITAFTYDEQGNLTGKSELPTTDAIGAQTFAAVRDMSKAINAIGYNYDPTTQLMTTIVETQTPANSMVPVQTDKLTVTYNQKGDVQTVKDSSDIITDAVLAYDTSGRQLKVKLEGVTQDYSYTPRGFVATRIEDGKLTTYVRDPIGRISEQALSSGDKLKFFYTSNGKLIDVTFNGKTIVGTKLSELAIAPFLNEDSFKNLSVAAAVDKLVSFFVPSAHAFSEVLLPACGLGPNPVCITGVVITGCKIIIVAGAAVIASSSTGSKSCSKTDSEKQCSEKDDCQHTATKWELEQAGINPHEVKKHLGQMRLYDICKCKSGGFVVKRKGCNGPIVEDLR